MNEPSPAAFRAFAQSLDQELSDSIARHGIPGAAAAIWHAGHFYETSAGIANQHTGVPTTPDTIFQVGSITKSFTATLAMQQVERGKLGLDLPVTTYLPQLQLADKQTAAIITLRQLLTHTSGIDGDLLTDTGRDVDALERLVAVLDTTKQLHAPGALFSYCNLGYNILGRVLEVSSGRSWNELLDQDLLRPLGLAHAVTIADDALRHRVAIGHVQGDDGQLQVVGAPFAPRSNGPSGMTMACTARDLITFGRMHLDGGCGHDGQHILTRASSAAMRTLQAPNPYSEKYRGWGIGWMLLNGAANPVFGHDGGACGNCAFLRVVPATQTIVALLVNHERGMGVFRDLLARQHAVLAGIDLPPSLMMPESVPNGFELAPYVGRYSRYGQVIDLQRNELRLSGRLYGEYVGASDVALELTPLDRNRFVAAAAGMLVPVHFSGFDDQGQPTRLHASDRVFIRQSLA